MNEPTHLDLFSGIGGFALAARWAGFRTIGFSEIDPYASAVLRKHWPDVPNFGDITKWRDWPAFRDIAIVTGGFPCQPFSAAGKRRGSKDHRYLWPAMLDVIGRYNPAWVLGENVPGILGMELDRCLTDLEGVGYWVQPIIVPACAREAKHIRERVWILANAKPKGREVVLPRNGGPSQAAGGKQGAPMDVYPCGFTRDKLAGFRSDDGEPALLRETYGIPSVVDRVEAIGNAIVPQVAEVILKNIRALI